MHSFIVYHLKLLILLYLYFAKIEISASSQFKVKSRSNHDTNQASASKPNIILIVADDLGYNDVSFHGSDQIPTPNIDYLAYNGVILNNYYVCPICSPTRSTLMTGRHPIHTGMQHSVILTAQPYGLALNETIMPQYFNDLGYVSHAIGKWHLGMYKWASTPVHRGFHSFFGYFMGKQDYFSHIDESFTGHSGLDFWRNTAPYSNYSGLYSTHLFRDQAISVIENHDKTKPLFLYLPFQSVHSANKHGDHLQAPNKTIEKFKYIKNHDRRVYAAMVSELDDAVGKIHETLKSEGMLENSIIVFTTDNGGPANGFDMNAANNFPLRGVKNTLWEGGVRGVGFINSPLLHKQAYVSQQMIHVSDWLPTLYHAAGGNVSTLTHIDGYDAWEMLSNNGSEVRHEILHNIDPLSDFAGLRVGNYKLVVGNIGMEWDKWYPPYQLEVDSQLLHVSNYSGFDKYSDYRIELNRKYHKLWDYDTQERIKQMWNSSGNQDNLVFESERVTRKKLNEKSVNYNPVKVECGPVPRNASSNCHPAKAPCLFDISSDPCEYHNLADKMPEKVLQLLKRLEEYEKTQVPPRNQDVDPDGFADVHAGVWVPWR